MINQCSTAKPLRITSLDPGFSLWSLTLWCKNIELSLADIWTLGRRHSVMIKKRYSSYPQARSCLIFSSIAFIRSFILGCPRPRPRPRPTPLLVTPRVGGDSPFRRCKGSALWLWRDAGEYAFFESSRKDSIGGKSGRELLAWTCSVCSSKSNESPSGDSSRSDDTL